MKKEYINCKNCPKFKEDADYGVFCQLKGYTIYSRKFTISGVEYVECMGEDCEV